MVNRPEQLGHPRFETGQNLGIAPVGLPGILRDQLHATRVDDVGGEPLVAEMA